MKKNDLIKKLQGIKGNPEVMLWNGIVRDYMPIKGLVQQELVKESKEHYLEMCRLELCRDLKDWTYQLPEQVKERLGKYYSKFGYEQNEYVTEQDIKEKKYLSKKVMVLDAKKTGKTYHDHLGKIEY